MKVVSLLVRFFAFLFNLTLGLGLFFLTLMVMSSGKHNINLPVVPLTDANLTYVLLAASLYCFVCMVLALRRGRWVRFPMFLWNLVVFALLLRTPLQPAFRFQGRQHAETGLYVLLMALVALLGSWLQWRRGRSK